MKGARAVKKSWYNTSRQLIDFVVANFIIARDRSEGLLTMTMKFRSASIHADLILFKILAKIEMQFYCPSRFSLVLGVFLFHFCFFFRFKKIEAFFRNLQLLKLGGYTISVHMSSSHKVIPVSSFFEAK